MKKKMNRDYGSQCIFVKITGGETITSNDSDTRIVKDVCNEQFNIRFIEMEPYSSTAARDLLKEALEECCGDRFKPPNIINVNSIAGGMLIIYSITGRKEQ